MTLNEQCVACACIAWAHVFQVACTEGELCGFIREVLHKKPGDENDGAAEVAVTDNGYQWRTGPASRVTLDEEKLWQSGQHFHPLAIVSTLAL